MSRKRPRENGVAHSHVTKKRKSKSGKPSRVVTALKDLSWQPVEVTAKLDDFEGFYGLEEIEDVDIRREENTGIIEFLAVKQHGDVDKHQNSSETETSMNDAPVGNDAVQSPESSWNGFSEDESSAQPSESGQVEKESSSPDGKVRPKDSRQEFNVFKELENLTEEIGCDVSAWEELNLSAETLGSLSRLEFQTPTSIQSAVIPELQAGHDVIGKAATGSGKTLAFGIPLLEHAIRRQEQTDLAAERSPAALILAPTRELALQLNSHLGSLFQIPSIPEITIATITGGLSVQKQRRLLQSASVVIATPGRLWELISESDDLLERLKTIKFLVLDEADRLLSDGHFAEVENILNQLNKDQSYSNRQTAIFSATFSKGLQQKLSSRTKRKYDTGEMSRDESLEYLLSKVSFRHPPKLIDVNPQSQMVATLEEFLIQCAAMERDLYLYAVLYNNPNKRVLIFTNSIHSVQRLTPFLQHLSLPAQALHSNMAQKARLRAIEQFSASDSSHAILVATDVAARGLDIPLIDIVVHYHPPRAADTYIHRSGRTARAEHSGQSILVCGPENVADVRRLVHQVHTSNKLRTSRLSSAIQPLDIDRRVVTNLRPRVELAKEIADATIAKGRHHSEEKWLREAAEELGVDYDEEEFEQDAKKMTRGGGGSGRKAKAKEARALTKKEIGVKKAQLRQLLAERVI